MKQTIKGFITDAQSGNPLSEVRIYTNSNLSHNLSNKKGEYSVSYDKDKDEEVFFSLPGYRTYSVSIFALEDTNRHNVVLVRKKGNQDKDDYELIQSALGGNQAAFGVLLERYRDSVNFVIYKMVSNTEDAEDLTMEAFGKAFNNLAKYRPDYAFSTWLFRIAINNTIDFIRKKRLKTLSLDSPIGNDPDSDIGYTRTVHSHDLDPEEAIIKEQRAELMRAVTSKLHDKYKDLIILRYFQEKSYHEISEEMNLPLGTVKAQLHRAKQLLSNVLKNSSNY